MSLSTTLLCIVGNTEQLEEINQRNAVCYCPCCPNIHFWEYEHQQWRLGHKVQKQSHSVCIVFFLFYLTVHCRVSVKKCRFLFWKLFFCLRFCISPQCKKLNNHTSVNNSYCILCTFPIEWHEHNYRGQLENMCRLSTEDHVTNILSHCSCEIKQHHMAAAITKSLLFGLFSLKYIFVDL